MKNKSNLKNRSRNRKQNIEMGKLWDEDLSHLQLKKSRKRAVVVFTIFFFCFAVISIRLIDLMILDHESLTGRAAQQYNREKVLKPQRGVIWDRKMRDMATNVESDSLYAVPSKMEDTRNISRKLAPLIKVSSKQLNGILLKKRTGILSGLQGKWMLVVCSGLTI